MSAIARKVGGSAKTGRPKESGSNARQVRASAARYKSQHRITGAEPMAGQGAAKRKAPVAKALAVTAESPVNGVDRYVDRLAHATPLEIVEIERQGVLGSFIKDLSKRMQIPSSRMFAILGVPKATAEKKAAAGERVAGGGGHAAIGMVRLLGIAHEIVANSTTAEAQNFDATQWLGKWIERPQPALGGHKPADLLDTPSGVDIVARLLGSIESGSYQ